MADITKCPGTNCPIKEQCNRFTAESGERQSWFAEIPGKYERYEHSPTTTRRQYDLVWKCEMFWGSSQDQIMNTLNEIVGK